MANSFTDLEADLFGERQLVARERIGGIAACTINADPSVQAAEGDTVRAAFAPEPTLNTSVTPSMTIPEGDDQSVANKTLVLDQVANVQFHYNGEEQKHLMNGAGYRSIYTKQVMQAIRKCANAVEARVMLVAKNQSGNAVGTSGTTPFGSNFDLVSDAWELLEDRGIPMDAEDMSLVLGNNAAGNLRKLDALWQANTSGDNNLLRQGLIGNLYGIDVRQSGQVASHTAGDAASYLVDFGAGYSVGDSTIHVDTGTGDFNDGDIITFGGDDERYVVQAQAGDGDIDLVLNAGLVEAIADGEAVALQNSYSAHMLLARPAIELAFREYAMPSEGDAATDRMTIQDPVSGLIFVISMYKGYKKVMFDITCLYGVKVWQPEYICTIQG